MVRQLRGGIDTVRATALVAVMATQMPVSAIAQDKSDDAGLRQGLAACERMTETAARLQCFDELAKSSRQAVPSSVAPSAGRAASRSNKLPAETPMHVAAPNSRSSRDTVSSPAAPPAKETKKETTDQKPVRKISVQVTRATTMPSGMLRIVTSDGMIWVQTEGKKVEPPKSGSEITISRNFMGGHWCQLGKWTAVRCERVDQPKEPARPTPHTTSALGQPGTNDTAAGAHPPSATPSEPPKSPASSEKTAVSQNTAPTPSGFGQQKQIRDRQPSKTTVTVAKANLVLNGKLRIITSDGSIWTQTEGPAVDTLPRPGSHVTIKRNFMGGYWCQLDKWTAVRCAEQTQ